MKRFFSILFLVTVLFAKFCEISDAVRYSSKNAKLLMMDMDDKDDKENTTEEEKTETKELFLSLSLTHYESSLLIEDKKDKNILAECAIYTNPFVEQIPQPPNLCLG